MVFLHSPSLHLSIRPTQTLFLANSPSFFHNPFMFFNTFHFILTHSVALNTKDIFSFLAVPPEGAHTYVRPPLPPHHTAMDRKRVLPCTRSSSAFIVILIVLFSSLVAMCDSDAEILVKFKESLENADALSGWNSTGSPCNGSHAAWQGVLCDGNGRVWGLKLENLELGGVLDVETLAELPDLRTISLMNNHFEGSLPNLTRLGSLKTIYLSHNKFYGEIAPTTFNGMMSLKKLHLAHNEFSGPIPATLATLPRLRELNLDNNSFEGELPEFRQDKLMVFNVANNELMGQIPNSLKHFNASAFQGNKDLCGPPLAACPNRKHASIWAIIIAAVLVAVALAALVAVFIVLRGKKKSPTEDTASTPTAQPKSPMEAMERMEQGHSPTGPPSPEHGKQGVKLTFLKDDVTKFDMPELLKASAEILGGGVFGSTYKASLGDRQSMVVKRFRHMNNVSRDEFNEHMWRLGRLNHRNVLPIIAFYYRKEEKLLVADYMENASLAFQLHGKRSVGHPSSPLTWPTRLSIVKGVARGLHYLYNELPSLTAPHGHLKSSNVLLDRQFNPILTDYGLVPVVNQEHAQENMISYKSPEYKHTRRITKKTDVWSLGILILEILTGRFPSNLIQHDGEDTDLASSVESVLESGGDVAAGVFDQDIGGKTNCEGEMMKLLRIGLSCCAVDVDRRPEIREAVERIDEVRERDGEEDFYSVYTSEADVRSSRGLSDDFRSINL